MRELEEFMAGEGIFSEDFSLGLGDFLEVGDEEKQDDELDPLQDGNPNPPPQVPPGKPPKEMFPGIDSKLSAAEMVGKYKKAILSRQSAYRDIHERWLAASPSTGQLLGTFSFCFVLGGGLFIRKG